MSQVICGFKSCMQPLFLLTLWITSWMLLMYFTPRNKALIGQLILQLVEMTNGKHQAADRQGESNKWSISQEAVEPKNRASRGGMFEVRKFRQATIG